MKPLPPLSFLLLVLLLLGGCAVGYPATPEGTPDYTNPIFGFGFGETATYVNTNWSRLLNAALVAGSVGVPGVGGIALLLNRFFKAATERAHLQGKEQGWNENDEDRLKKAGIVATTEVAG